MSENAIEEQPAEQEEALDFVYCGRRWSDAHSKLYVSVRPIKDGELRKEMLFEFSRKAHRTVGGVYTGATFSTTSARGLEASLKYTRQWQDRADLIDWQSRDGAAESSARTKKLEGDAKKVSEIEKIMLPLRKQFEGYRAKRDQAGMKALRAAVIAALTSTPRQTEL